MDRLSKISLVAIILVVFIHAYNISVVFGGEMVGELYSLDWWIQSSIGDGISRVGVPLFFTISGYRLLHGVDSFSGSVWWIKLKKRFKSLVIPFLIWSVMGLLFISVLQLFPMSKPFFNSEPIMSKTFKEVLHIVFISPFPYQLWFLQVLWLLIILSPLCLAVINLLNIRILLPGLALIWYCFGGYNGWVEYFFEGLVFFSLGMLLQRKNFRLNWHRYIHWMPIVWFGLILGKLWMIPIDSTFAVNVVSKLSVLVGMLVVWYYVPIFLKRDRIPSVVLGQTFFIFLAHEPLLTLVKKAFIGSGVAISLSLVYFVSVFIVVSSTLVIGVALKRYTPSIYSILTGGR